MRWVGIYHMQGGGAGFLVGKPAGRWSHRKPRCRWEDNIKMDLNETRWEKNDLLNSLNSPLDVMLWLTCAVTRSISMFRLKNVSTSTVPHNGWR